MTKLLSGQQLYTAKHITNQLANKLLDDPPSPRPYSPLPICVHTCSYAMQSIALDQFNAQIQTPQTLNPPIIKLNDFDYQIENVPETFTTFMLMGEFDTILFNNWYSIHTHKEAQAIHYCKLSCPATMRFKAIGPWGPAKFAHVPQDSPSWDKNTDSYPFAFGWPGAEWVTGIFNFIVAGPNDFRHSITDYSMSRGMELRCYWGVGSIPPGFIVITRGDDGSYSYSQSRP